MSPGGRSLGLARHGSLGLDVVVAEATDAGEHTQCGGGLDSARGPPTWAPGRTGGGDANTLLNTHGSHFVEQDWPHGHGVHVDAQGPALRGNPQIM